MVYPPIEGSEFRKLAKITRVGSYHCHSQTARTHRHQRVVGSVVPFQFPRSHTSRLGGRALCQFVNRVLSVVAGGQAKFVQHHLFRLSICLVIPRINGTEILPLPLAPQEHPPQIVFPSGYILNGATLSPLVTF
jgi:hypothetical protein